VFYSRFLFEIWEILTVQSKVTESTEITTCKTSSA